MSPGWAPAGGAVLLVVLAVDVFLTVLHASSGAGPYTSLQNRAIWRTMRLAASLLPGRRRVLSLAAPLMALATPLAWVVLLTVGCALVYHPVVATFPADPPTAVPAWMTALYYSGYLTSTLGLGDVVPTGGGWRLAAVVQAGLGFALFSAAITYVLSIYGRHNDDAAFALHVHNAFQDSDLVDWGPEGSSRRTVARGLALDLGASLAGVNAAHRQYPILHYFHDRPEQSLVVQVGHLLDFLDRAPEGERGGAARSLERGLVDFMEQMPFETEGGGSGVEGLRARHRSLLDAHGFDGAA